MNVEPHVLAYTAGFLDGEGSVQINPTYNGRKYYWRLSVNMTNTNTDVLPWLQEKFNGMGSLRDYPTRGGVPGRRVWRWSMYSKQADEFLRLVYPYVIAKKPIIEAAIKFREHSVEIKPGMKHGMSEESIKERNKWALVAREINAKTSRILTKKLDRVVL